MNKYSAMVHFFLGSLFTLAVVMQLSFKQTPESKEISVGTTEKAVWTVPPIPSMLSFAGEKAPIDRWDIKEKFDKEFLNNYYSQGNILYLIKLANRNFPIISERLRINGVPDDFKYLCIAESNMQHWAVSKSGAVGYWQFMDGTASGYGLETNGQVDERQSLEKATDAACKYLRQAYAKFGNWTAAAASYNCGMGGYARQAAFQETNNYYDLHLPEETNKYVLRILTFKYLVENADKLGFRVEEEDKYQPLPFEMVHVSSSIPNLAEWAIARGTNYKMLVAMNPWIKGRSLTVAGGKTYNIKLPKE